MPSDPLVVTLARRQLDAYNRADLDAFCACYHSNVEVLDADGSVSVRGMSAFRERYAGLFARFAEVTGTVTERLVLAPHVVEREEWSRVDRTTRERVGGVVLVRYTERDELLRWVEFLKAEVVA